MDIAEFASLGAQIVEVGEKLKEARVRRDAANAEISELEKQLGPLLTRHAQLIAEVVGSPMPTAPIQPVFQPVHVNGGPVPQPQGGPATKEALAVVKKRLVEFLEDAEPGVSAAEVAQALRLDPLIVRQAMADLSRSGR